MNFYPNLSSMELTSKPCTSREQGEKLMGLGLKKETADMVWHYTKSHSDLMRWELKPHPPITINNFQGNISRLNIFKQKNSYGEVMTGEEYFYELWGRDIPAWSLTRLCELLPKKICYQGILYELHIEVAEEMISYCPCASSRRLRKLEYFYGEETIYDNIIKGVRWLITEGYFNDEYLDNVEMSNYGT